MKKIIVIGSGFGGITLSIILQSHGIPTILLEQRDKPGGCAYVYKDKGFTFDAGPTVITDIYEIKNLFKISCKNINDYVEFLPVNPFYRLCWEDGKVLNYDNNKKNLEEQIYKFNPQDVYGYRKFLAFSRKVFKEGYLKLGSRPFLYFRDMIKVSPKLIQLQAWRSVYSKVSSFIEDDYLRQAFSFHTLLIGGNPFKTSSIYTLIHALEMKCGIWFPRGGTNVLINSMIKLFNELGGEVMLNSKVTRLETINNTITSVLLNDGRRLNTLAVASNADVVHTYYNLLRDHQSSFDKGLSLQYKKMSNSLFVLYLGLNRKYDNLSHHTIIFGGKYRELINNIFNYNGISDYFSLYIHSPCVTDTSIAPPGCGAYYILAPVPNLGVANLDWTVEGPRLRDSILNYLEKNYMKDLKSSIITHRMFTPCDFRDTLNTFNGSAFSFEPILLQSAWFRTHNRDKNIKNLYFVGSGTHPGAGIPGVINSAKVTSSLMLENL